MTRTNQVQPFIRGVGDESASYDSNFRGTTSKGTSVTAVYLPNPRQSRRHYDDDSEYFTGGETLIVNMKPAVSTSGEVTTVSTWD
ncbi:hypothetical protein [Bacteroides cellulosilyticus]|uniref:hypothetical protein n=1 Tax=Bacteroides cellulosilyticus TaxID=246787 RepID=UPI002F96911C